MTVDDDVEGWQREPSVVGEECIFGCFSPHVMSCLSPQPDLLVASKCDVVKVIMALVMLIMPKLHGYSPETFGSGFHTAINGAQPAA
jgi:hypothetical protein